MSIYYEDKNVLNMKTIYFNVSKIMAKMKIGDDHYIIEVIAI